MSIYIYIPDKWGLDRFAASLAGLLPLDFDSLFNNYISRININEYIYICQLFVRN